MRARAFVLLLLCIFVLGTTAGALGPVFHVPSRLGKLVAGIVAVAAFLYLDRHTGRQAAWDSSPEQPRS